MARRSDALAWPPRSPRPTRRARRAYGRSAVAAAPACASSPSGMPSPPPARCSRKSCRLWPPPPSGGRRPARRAPRSARAPGPGAEAGAAASLLAGSRDRRRPTSSAGPSSPARRAAPPGAARPACAGRSPAPRSRRRLRPRRPLGPAARACSPAPPSRVGRLVRLLPRQGRAGRDLDVAERMFASPFDFRRQAVLVLEHDPHAAFAAGELPARQAERLRQPHRASPAAACWPCSPTGANGAGRRRRRRACRSTTASCCWPRACTAAPPLWPRSSAATRPPCCSASTRSGPGRTSPATCSSAWSSPSCRSRARTPASAPAGGPPRRRGATGSGDFYLPEAVLRFRQGFGRLIRTESDAGVIVVLDHRLTQKSLPA